MDIIAEIKAAHSAYLQDAWDEHLVTWWYEQPKANLRKCVRVFLTTNNMDLEDFYPLLRVPRYHHQWHTCVTRFVAAYLPKLSTALWGDKLDREELLKRLKATKMDTAKRALDYDKYRREHKEEADAVRDANAFSTLKKIRADARLATSKSNWKVCK